MSKVVLRIEDGVDRKDVERTFYQMRNPFRQFADGVVTELDMMCHILHAQAADLCPRGARVLDVCCGRGLMIPFLRYRGKEISGYVGIDAHPPNAKWKDGFDPRYESRQKNGGWGFKTEFIEANASSMSRAVTERLGSAKFDMIIYTGSIEHMRPEDQQKSLIECRTLAKRSSTLFLTCPITPFNRSGWKTQYKAHIYEPPEKELMGWLDQASWKVIRRIGLITKATHFKKVLTGSALMMGEKIYNDLPREVSLPLIAYLYPSSALEMAYICQVAT